jgi:hypothetical protein
MKEIPISELAKRVCDLSVNEKMYVRENPDSEIFGITCLNLFESDLIIISHLGGGYSSMFDTSTTNEEKEMYSWLQHAFGANDCDKNVYLLEDMVPDFTSQINNLRNDIISNIIKILNENNLTEIELIGIIEEPTSVLWTDGETWYDSPVTKVSLADKGISVDVEDKYENAAATLDSVDMDLAFQNLSWLDNIHNNILEAIKST